MKTVIILIVIMALGLLSVIILAPSNQWRLVIDDVVMSDSLNEDDCDREATRAVAQFVNAEVIMCERY